MLEDQAQREQEQLNAMQSEEEDIRQHHHDEEERDGANGEEEDAVSGYEHLDPNR
jgi:hypothetical protein